MRKITQGEIQGQIEKGLFMRSITIISHKRYMWEEEKKLGRMTGGKKNIGRRGTETWEWFAETKERVSKESH